ncbi:hypothetical protein [Prevotella sp. P4-119]|nr:hypothetical protein [Prevotella sp. P4-119]
MTKAKPFIKWVGGKGKFIELNQIAIQQMQVLEGNNNRNVLK